MLFPEAPEFYATYMMANIKNHIIYTDKIRLSVIQLNNIKLATEEDRLYQIDKWAALFKAKTWKELKIMAVSNQYMKSAAHTLYELSADQFVREQCRAREEYEAYERYRDRQIASLTQEIEALRKESSDKEKALTDKDTEIAKLKELLNKKD